MKPLPLSAAANPWAKEQSHPSENPSTTDHVCVGLTNSKGELCKETQTTSPKGTLEALANCCAPPAEQTQG